MAQLRQKEKQFQQYAARIVLVGLGTPEETAAFKEQFHVPFPMIADPQKRLFKAFQLKQATPKDLLSVSMAMKGLSALARGHHIGIPKGDVRQLPGVFIIDMDGRVRFTHFAKDPADHPQADVLLKFLQSNQDMIPLKDRVDPQSLSSAQQELAGFAPGRRKENTVQGKQRDGQ